MIDAACVRGGARNMEGIDVSSVRSPRMRQEVPAQKCVGEVLLARVRQSDPMPAVSAEEEAGARIQEVAIGLMVLVIPWALLA